MIPKTIHYCWISGDPYPPLTGNCITSWKKHLPEYEFVLWDLEKISTIQNVWLQQTIENKKYAFAADFIRLYALYHFGGIYLDADVEVVGSFSSFLVHQMFIGLDYNDYFEPAIIGAVPEHPLIKSFLLYYENRPFVKANGQFDMRPLPSILQKIKHNKFNFKPDNKVQTIDEEKITIYPYDFFSPKSEYFRNIKTTKNTITIHHFDGNWVRKDFRFVMKRILHQFLILAGGRIFHKKILELIRSFDQHKF
jgi:mannosyltransferase OCH1-like enzyme